MTTGKQSTTPGGETGWVRKLMIAAAIAGIAGPPIAVIAIAVGPADADETLVTTTSAGPTSTRAEGSTPGPGPTEPATTMPLNDQSCPPVQKPSAGVDPLQREAFLVRWNTAASAAGADGCTSGSENWSFQDSAGVKQVVGHSSVALDLSPTSEVTEVRVSLADSSEADRVTMVVASTFGNSADEVAALIDGGLNRPCADGVAYSLETAAYGPTTRITAATC